MTRGLDNCNMQVHWFTEYACPVRDRISTTCSFSNADAEFDLTPLQKEWKVVQKDGGSSYDITFNVCGKVNCISGILPVNLVDCNLIL